MLKFEKVSRSEIVADGFSFGRPPDNGFAADVGSTTSTNNTQHWSLYRKKVKTPDFVGIFDQVAYAADSSPTCAPQMIYHKRNHSFDAMPQSGAISGRPYGRTPQQHQYFGDNNGTMSFCRQVALPGGPNGQFGLYRPDSYFLKPGRKTFSEMDIRKAVLEAPTTRGPYYGGVSKFSASLENGLDFVAKNKCASPLSETTDTRSDTDEPMIKHVFNPNEFRNQRNTLKRSSANQRQRRFNAASSVYPTAAPPTGVVLHPPYDQQSYGGNIYMQNKRHHHRHYFSNLDLFTTSSTYNYLRYAKADFVQNDINIGGYKQPHLIARNIGFEIDKRSLFDILIFRSPKYETRLENVSFELCAGETLAIMYTSELEVNALFSVMTTTHFSRGRTEGSFLVNGLPLRSKHLADRTAYVCLHDICPHLTVKEQLRLMSSFVKPASQAFQSNSMISQLIQTLALGPVQDRLIETLTYCEKQRIKIASQILLDTDFLLLDNISKCMDLYDTAFIIDYLRDWALKLNRIVVMAINPPTFEILAMFHKVALLASGRLIYFGGSDKMLNYFENVNYACPLFKNPCDYYVDLLTHDYLTVEASMESQERIKRLAEHWANIAPVQTDTNHIGMLPPKVKKSNVFLAIFWIYYRFWLILFNTPWRYVGELFYSFLTSLTLGIIYYQLTLAKQGGINDRIGLLHTISSLGLLPNLFLNVQRTSEEKRLIFQDTLHRLYPKISFFAAKFGFEIPLAIFIYGIYCTPIFFMAKLLSISNDQGLSYAMFLALTLLHCLAFRIASWTFAYAIPNKYLAMLATGVLLCLCSLSSGVTVHPNNSWFAFDMCHNVCPNYWFHLILSEYEFSSNLSKPESSPTSRTLNFRTLTAAPLQFGCDPKEIKYGPILTTLPCPVVNGDEAFKFLNLTMKDQQYANFPVGFSAMVGFVLIFHCLTVFCIYCSYVPVSKIKRSQV